jgi:hypothetical protein
MQVAGASNTLPLSFAAALANEYWAARRCGGKRQRQVPVNEALRFW